MTEHETRERIVALARIMRKAVMPEITMPNGSVCIDYCLISAVAFVAALERAPGGESVAVDFTDAFAHHLELARAAAEKKNLRPQP